MGKCGCAQAGSDCRCILEAGDDLVITGVGSRSNPYVISRSGASASLTVADTGTINLSLSGSGQSSDPYVLSGALQQPITLTAPTMTGGRVLNAALNNPVINGAGQTFHVRRTTTTNVTNGTYGTVLTSAGVPAGTYALKAVIFRTTASIGIRFNLSTGGIGFALHQDIANTDPSGAANSGNVITLPASTALCTVVTGFVTLQLNGDTVVLQCSGSGGTATIDTATYMTLTRRYP